MTTPERVVCADCGRPLTPAAARWDGEPTTVGYNGCPDHPRALVVTEQKYRAQFVDPGGPLCQDDHEYLTGTGRYAEFPDGEFQTGAQWNDPGYFDCLEREDGAEYEGWAE